MARILSFFAAAALGASCLAIAASEAPGIRVITHADRVDVVVDETLLRAIYLRRIRSWPDGEPIKAFVLPDDSEAHRRFCRVYLNVLPRVLRAAWDELVFSGTGFSPIVVKSQDEMRRRVQETPGSIGYVMAEKGSSS